MKKEISLVNRLEWFCCILVVLCFLFSVPPVCADRGLSIKLKSRQFEPVPETRSVFETMRALNIERKHVLIQLYSIPTAEERTFIEAAGIKLFGYVPEDCEWQSRLVEPQ